MRVIYHDPKRLTPDKEHELGAEWAVVRPRLDADALTPSQRVASVEAAPTKAGGETIDASDDAVARIADLLAEAKVI